MKDRSNDSSHHERTLLPPSYISLPTPVREHWLEQEIAQWVHHEGSIQQLISPRANALTTELHLAPYTSHGALAGTRNSSMGQPWRIDPTTHCTMSERSYHGATSRSHTNRGALAGTRNSSMGQPWRINPTTHRTMSEHSYHRATSCSLHQSWLEWEIAQWVHHEGSIQRLISPRANALTTELHPAPYTSHGWNEK